MVLAIDSTKGETDLCEEAYPMDERFWLLSTAYNTGYECFECVIVSNLRY